MRIWSIHPSYLDSKGLVACWRETLLAQEVLKGNTKGYKNHPQLVRFKNCQYPLRAIGTYLTEIYEEGKYRGYKFNPNKIEYFYCFDVNNLTVTKEQLIYEFNHLQDKLLKRGLSKYYENGQLIKTDEKNIKSHPLFQVVDGPIETWEKIK